MKNDPGMDFYGDWKLVTILVGHNDICSHACERFDPFSPIKDATPSAYVKNMAAVLDVLHKELPRAFVSVLAIAGQFFKILRRSYLASGIKKENSLLQICRSCWRSTRSRSLA